MRAAEETPWVSSLAFFHKPALGSGYNACTFLRCLLEEMASPEELAKIKDDVPTLIDIVRTGKGDVLRVQAAIYLHDKALKSDSVSTHSPHELALPKQHYLSS